MENNKQPCLGGSQAERQGRKMLVRNKMECKECIKYDVCNQREILAALELKHLKVYVTTNTNNIITMKQLNNQYGIYVEVVCEKYIYNHFYNGGTTND